MNQWRSEIWINAGGGCYWTPFQTGRDLDSAATLEERNRNDGAQTRNRRTTFWALVVAILTLVAAVFFGYWQMRTDTPKVESKTEQAPAQAE